MAVVTVCRVCGREFEADRARWPTRRGRSHATYGPAVPSRVRLPCPRRKGCGVDERMLLAAHEAGHCVTVVTVGGMARSVSLRPPQTEATFRGVGARDELLVLRAGNAAVAIAKGRKWSEHDAADADRLVRRHVKDLAYITG
jgi:hypothetical protein